jgi:hypothetical protein
MATLTDRLGNEIAGYLQEQIPAPEGQQDKGFFGFLQFSPSQQQRSITVEEFHQRNQEFLQQSDYARSKMQKAMRDNSPYRQYVIDCVGTEQGHASLIFAYRFLHFRFQAHDHVASPTVSSTWAVLN